ncbi:MAG TPA: hypothetical protein VEY31_12970 [Roseococcus sp.]|jgi:hypothetical protein|nr:hypothetical protein [Roseococcus sp.]
MQRRHRTAHLRIWLVLAVVLPALLFAGWLLRPSVPLDAPVRLEAP